MNRAAAQLGMHESHFVNPNGLPAADHYSSARDMAVLARALYAEFPEQAGLFNLGELSLGSELIPNHNNLLGRYPGVDGMKTGFTCAAGFNVVASAFRDGRRIVVVVFGAPSVKARTEKVAALLDRAFANVDRPSGSILALPAATTDTPPDMHALVCSGARGRLIAQFNAEVEQLDQPLEPQSNRRHRSLGAQSRAGDAVQLADGDRSGSPTATRISSMPTPVFDPVPVHGSAPTPAIPASSPSPREPHSPIGTSTPPVTAEAYAMPATVSVASPACRSPSIRPPCPLRGRQRQARARAHIAVVPA